MGRLASPWVLFAWTLLLGLGPPMDVNALRVATTLLEDLQASDLAVAAQVLNEEPGAGVTRVFLQVDEIITGEAETGTVSVLAPPDPKVQPEGGLATVTVSEGIGYAVGEHVLVFLKQAPPSLLARNRMDSAYVTIRKVGLGERQGQGQGKGREFLAGVRRLAEAAKLPEGQSRELAFLSLLTGHHDLVVESAVKELGRMKSRRAVGPLARLTRDVNASVRFQIVDAMRQIGGNDAVAVISSALEDPSPRVRSRAASTLGWMRVKGAEDRLLEMVLTKDEDEGVRINAVLALGKMESTKAVPFLQDALKDESLSPPLRRSMQATLKSLQRQPGA